MLPQAALQPAALLTKELAKSRRQYPEHAANSSELPLSGIQQRRPEVAARPAPNADVQHQGARFEEAKLGSDSQEGRGPGRSPSTSAPDPDESWTWKQAAPGTPDSQLAPRREERDETAGTLGRLEQAVLSDLVRARSAVSDQWERVRSKWNGVKDPRLRRLGWVGVATAVLFFTPIGSEIWSGVRGGMEYVGAESRTRAAFQFIENFQDGILAQWDGEGLSTDDESSAVRAASLTLYGETMGLSDYFMDFDFLLDRPSIGWVVRAKGRDSYCAFKLEQTGRKNDRRYKLIRYAMVQGDIDPKHQIEVDVTPDFREEGRNRISVRITEQRIKTFLNGRGVDFWNDKFFHEGGVGFWNEDGASAQIQRVAVYGNEDFWGLALYAALETADSVRQFFSAGAPAADPSQAKM